MSDITDDTAIRGMLARIDRDIAEQSKLRAESEKFIAEQRKLIAEEAKLNSERRKLDRDRWLAPSLAVSGLIGGLLTIGVTIAKALGVLQ